MSLSTDFVNEILLQKNRDGCNLELFLETDTVKWTLCITKFVGGKAALKFSTMQTVKLIFKFVVLVKMVSPFCLFFWGQFMAVGTLHVVRFITQYLH